MVYSRHTIAAAKPASRSSDPLAAKALWSGVVYVEESKPLHQDLRGLLIATVTLALSSCGQNLYKFPQYTFANRPIPPSKLANRVLVGITVNGTSGSLAILDGLRDIRSNIQNTIMSFSITGYSGGYPSLILNYPAELTGYVYSATDGSVAAINYGTEASTGSAGTLPALSSSLYIPPTRAAIYSAEETTGQLVVLDNATGRAFALNLPNVYRVASNIGNTTALAMVRNSNTLYRVVKLNSNQSAPPGNIDCQPINLPVYCVVPVPGAYDRPQGAYFSPDGNSVYVLNAGPEYGGKTASISVLSLGPLNINTVPTTFPDTNPVTANLPIPGGVTTAISDGTTLYLAGQQLMPDGLFTGNLTTVTQSTLAITGKYSISDGNHSKLLFADDNTLWIGSQLCANGERAKLKQNYNCLTRFDLGAKTATIVPAVDPTSATSSVPYPNTNNDTHYYGSLTGICWVETFHKVYTAYGGQVHAFNTADGSEINNQFITVQGTVLDVAYMDASTDETD